MAELGDRVIKPRLDHSGSLSFRSWDGRNFCRMQSVDRRIGTSLNILKFKVFDNSAIGHGTERNNRSRANLPGACAASGGRTSNETQGSAGRRTKSETLCLMLFAIAYDSPNLTSRGRRIDANRGSRSSALRNCRPSSSLTHSTLQRRRSLN